MIDLTNAYCYDIETFPNCFTLAVEGLYSDQKAIWEISPYRDERTYMFEYLHWLVSMQAPMIGFNNLHFDYPVMHYIFNNPNCTVQQIYEKAMSVIKSKDRFAHMVWPRDRFAPQIDLYKINHFDNRAKATSLKWLQINMRSPSVVDMPIEVGTVLDSHQIDGSLKPYNVHDVSMTKDFAYYNRQAIDFRNSLVNKFGIEVLNWNDTKIGEEMIINRLPDQLLYDRSTGRKQKRQTYRDKIKVNDIIFPYIKFEHPELNKILASFRATEIGEKTKGLFENFHADVGGVRFHFGTGGVHGSVERKRFYSDENFVVQDIDVASLYPSIAIANGLAPAHLGQQFVDVYSDLPKERKKWQKEKGKKCVEANALKLASNGVYGKSNSEYSVFYDPQFTMTITINGQLMLCMLAEQLIKVPTLQLIQINTDGMTYYVDRQYGDQCRAIWNWWENLTGLVLEDVDYAHMHVRDVNSYVAVDTEGNVKAKGAYWTPEEENWQESISTSQPPAWHKNLSNTVSTRAAVDYLVRGTDPGIYITSCKNPMEFTCAVKAKGQDKLYFNGEPVQSTTRYYVSRLGGQLIKEAPPKGPAGMPKRANGVTEEKYLQVMEANGWQWDETVCTKNKSVYTDRKSTVVSNGGVKICNDIDDFDFDDIDFAWYVNETIKLIF